MSNKLKSTLYKFCARYGLDLHRARSAWSGRGRLRSNRAEFERQREGALDPGAFPMGTAWPVTYEFSSTAGTNSGHYFHQDLYVAREIFERRPRRHIDVGSRVDGFVAHVAVFREIDVLDIRPLESSDTKIRFFQGDAMGALPTDLTADSVSCLHALEHFGLGRYGDPINFDGWRKGLDNLISMVETGGHLYLSVPAGQNQRVEFNAHRVFSVPYLRDVLTKSFEVERFSFVDDSGFLHPDLDPYSPEAERGFQATMGCAIWTLRKLEGSGT